MKKAFVLVLFLVASLAEGHLSHATRMAVESVQLDDDMEDLRHADEVEKGTTDKCTKNGYSKHQLQQEDKYRGRFYDPEDGNKELASTCKSNTSNARGTYTADLAPCTFKFHTIIEDKVKDHYLSSACSDSNIVEVYQDKEGDPLEEYVVFWPDECVGDFQRCYLVDRDEEILLRHMCKHGWELPEGTTHVSVDCTADKTRKKEQINKKFENRESQQNRDESFFQHQKKQARELYAFITGLATVGLLLGAFCLRLTYRYGFSPFLNTLKRSKSDPELRGLTSGETSRV